MKLCFAQRQNDAEMLVYPTFERDYDAGRDKMEQTVPIATDMKNVAFKNLCMCAV